MAKIGRNAPCPCGSGKKFKKCCMDKIVPSISEIRRDYHWSSEEIEELTTEEIISKLWGFGVRFDERKFQKDVRRFYSACELADYWKEKFPITAVGFDVDFVWMACMVLWKRLSPDVVNSEQLDDVMQQGYDLVEAEGIDKTAEGCKLWLQVWDHLKHRFDNNMKSIEDAEKVFSGMQCLFNWCQDLEEALHNAGISDPSFFRKRIEFCKEFYSFFPDSGELTIVNMKRAEAESHFFLGDAKQGDKAFQALIEEFPNNVWAYIGWGDMYSLFSPPNIEQNLTKAKEIYEMALNINSKEKNYVIDRLESLNEAQN